MVDRCTGHCCRNFPLPYAPHDLRARAPTIVDGEFIADMVIPIGPHDREGFYTYACRHHDDVTGDCRAYDQRPDMCRRYPYGNLCEYAECTLPAESQRETRKSLAVVG